MVHHSIDFMHVQKNVCEALVGTLLDIPGKTKDTLNAWMDLEEMKLRKDVHHETLENGSKKLPTACYALSKQEKMSLCNFLHGIKVPIGYSDNVSGMVNMKTLKLCFKKSHDCHILIGQFLPITIRGIFPIKVQDMIMKLFSFFNAIHFIQGHKTTRKLTKTVVFKTYYGFIEEIWELEYKENLKVPLFRWQWIRLQME
jgi:hypothetical protein